MNWFSGGVFLGITAWTALPLGLIFLAGKIPSEKVCLLIRILYLPALAIAAFAFYWFWAGDGATNLWLVPLIFAITTTIFFRYLKPRWQRVLRGFDLSCFLVVLAGYATIWIVVLSYALTGQQLRIE